MRVLVLLICCVVVMTSSARAQEIWPGSYPEGPVWIDDTLYWAEMRSDRVMRWTGNAPEVFFEQPGCGPTAIARYRAKDLLILCHLSATLVHTDLNSTVLSTIDRATDGTPLRDPNDASADGQGGVWFTDPGRFSKSAPPEGALYYLAPDGTLTRHAEGLAYGNGVFVDQAGSRVLVSEHLARRVLSFPILQTGLGAPQILFEINSFDIPQPRLYPEAGPDGLEIGPEGTLWVAEYGATRLLGWRPDFGLVAATQVDTKFVTNIAFGPDGLAAMTGAYQNDEAPYRGAMWVFPSEALTGLVEQP